MTVNRLCASGLEAIAQADMRIRSGVQRVVIAGGAETMSMLPMGGIKPRPNPWLAENYPAALLTMGLTAERVAKHYNISREDADAFSLASHQKAVAAQASRPIRRGAWCPSMSRTPLRAPKPANPLRQIPFSLPTKVLAPTRLPRRSLH